MNITTTNARILCEDCNGAPHDIPSNPFAPREDGLNPFTVVRDWREDWWEQSTDVRFTDEPQIFHVWAASGSDASDEAERLAELCWGAEAAGYSSAVAILRGHAPFAKD
ncbi:hypothetical protein [Streptomyces sp. NPDC006631]|uniref:hypothetical protein n=1 Tax=Streptomyces sp. NPDC006631 TaxID=3364752 RepID=UPI0036B39F66